MAIIARVGHRDGDRRAYRSITRLLFYGSLWSLLVGAVLLIALERRENASVRLELVAIRESLESDFSSSKAMLELSPRALLRTGFKYDSPEQVAIFRAQLLRYPHYAHALAEIAATHDDIKKAQKIVLSFSVGGTRSAIYRLSLLEKMQRTLQGGGICSDHTEIFLALAAATGMWAREMQNDRHSFIGFYSSSHRKWIFIDPLLAIMATDTRGRYLSAREIRKARLHNRPIHYVFFGTAPGHPMSTADPLFQYCYGSADRFHRLALAYGNNVIEEDRFEEQVAWAPWELQKLLVLVSGVHPHVVTFADRYNRNEVHATQHLRWTALTCGAGMILCLTLYPLQKLCRLAARHVRYTASHPKQTDSLPQEN
jgi:hypothetical protein